MWRKPDRPPAAPERANPADGVLDNRLGGFAPGDANQFEKRKDPQWRRMPHRRQQFWNSFDVADRRGSAANKHLRSVLPRLAIFGNVPKPLRCGNEFQPIGKELWWPELPSHIGIIEMAMGIDEARHENGVAQINGRAGCKSFYLRPTAGGG